MMIYDTITMHFRKAFTGLIFNYRLLGNEQTKICNEPPVRLLG